MVPAADDLEHGSGRPRIVALLEDRIEGDAVRPQRGVLDDVGLNGPESSGPAEHALRNSEQLLRRVELGVLGRRRTHHQDAEGVRRLGLRGRCFQVFPHEGVRAEREDVGRHGAHAPSAALRRNDRDAERGELDPTARIRDGGEPAAIDRPRREASRGTSAQQHSGREDPSESDHGGASPAPSRVSAVPVPSGEPGPGDHAGPGAPRDGRRVAETSAGPAVKGSAAIQARSSAVPPEPAASIRSTVHSRTMRAVVALGQAVEKPAVEGLVHLEVARAARLVGEPAGRDDRDADVRRPARRHDLAGAPRPGDRRARTRGWAAPCSSA